MKTKLHVPFAEQVAIASETGYDAVCLRASQDGVQTPLVDLRRMRETVEAHRLRDG